MTQLLTGEGLESFSIESYGSSNRYGVCSERSLDLCMKLHHDSGPVRFGIKQCDIRSFVGDVVKLHVWA